MLLWYTFAEVIKGLKKEERLVILSSYREMGWTDSSSGSDLDLDILEEDMQEVAFTKMLVPLFLKTCNIWNEVVNNGITTSLVTCWMTEIFLLGESRLVFVLLGHLEIIFMLLERRASFMSYIFKTWRIKIMCWQMAPGLYKVPYFMLLIGNPTSDYHMCK